MSLCWLLNIMNPISKQQQNSILNPLNWRYLSTLCIETTTITGGWSLPQFNCCSCKIWLVIINRRCNSWKVAASIVQTFVATKCSHCAAKTGLKLQTCTFQRQLYICVCKTRRQFCSDEVSSAATKQPRVFAPTNILWSQKNRPQDLKLVPVTGLLSLTWPVVFATANLHGAAAAKTGMQFVAAKSIYCYESVSRVWT